MPSPRPRSAPASEAVHRCCHQLRCSEGAADEMFTLPGLRLGAANYIYPSDAGSDPSEQRPAKTSDPVVGAAQRQTCGRFLGRLATF